MQNNSQFGNFRTKKFCDVWSDVQSFLDEYKQSKLTSDLTDDNVTKLYFLLYSKYGNSTIANFDESQFKYRVWAIIYQYGPAWQKKLDLQSQIRNLSESDLLEGNKTIQNHAFNDSSQPTTATLEEVNFIDDQITHNYKRSKLNAYQLQWQLIETDVTEEFLNRFKDLFLRIVQPYRPLWYATNTNEGDEDDE